MGVEGPIDYDVANEALPPQDGEDGALEPLLVTALTARPEIASATEQVKAQQLLIKSGRGAYGPTISVGASFIQTTETGTNYVGWDVAAGITLTWNIFQGGLTKGMVHEAEGNLGFALGAARRTTPTSPRGRRSGAAGDPSGEGGAVLVEKMRWSRRDSGWPSQRGATRTAPAA